MYLIELTGSNGQPVYLNSQEIASIANYEPLSQAAPRPGGKTIIGLSNGRDAVVRETASELIEKLAAQGLLA